MPDFDGLSPVMRVEYALIQILAHFQLKILSVGSVFSICSTNIKLRRSSV